MTVVSEKTNAPARLADVYPPEQYTARRVAILGGRGVIPASHAMSTPALFDACGRNTGNLAFFHALASHIVANITYFGWEFDPEHINNHADCLVIAAANQLNPAWDLGAVASRLEKVRVPLCVVGLGAQWHGDVADVRLTNGTARFAKVIGERVRALGVRGERSGGVLDKIGVRNWDVVGCPSHFLNLEDARLGRRNFMKLNGWGGPPEKVIINFDVGSGMARGLAKIEKLVGDAFISCVCQAPLAAVAMARKDVIAHDNEYKAVIEAYALMTEDFRTRALRSAVTFFSVDAWMEWCRSYDLSIGTRLHGNIVAMQSGVPAIVVTHDGRTEELAATLKMPALGVAEFARGAWTFDDLFRACAFDPDAYDANRIDLSRRYVRLLEWAGLRLSAKLLAMASVK